MSKRILIDLEKIRDPFSGLGQFCAHLKYYFDKSSLRITYWLPSKYQKIARQLKFFLPSTDVFHALHQDCQYMPWRKKTKYILTIHDLNALAETKREKSRKRYFRNYKKRIARANVITFISHFAKSEVEKVYDLSKKETHVIYNGIALGAEISKPDFTVDTPFIFSVGTVLPKKNFHVLIDFLKLLPDYKIILAGTINNVYAQGMIETIKAEGLSDRFHLIGTIDEAHKIWYYKHASAFIFPSLLEGFGLPVAEAMSLGLPLFISDKTSLPEIGGTDAFYFKSFDPLEMREVFIEGMRIFDEARKQRLIERSKMFSWEQAAASYMEIYKKL